MSDCPICLEYIQSTDITYTNGCDHGFHLGCLWQWLQVNNSCPLCRTVQPSRQIDIKNYIEIKYNSINTNYYIYTINYDYS